MAANSYHNTAVAVYMEEDLEEKVDKRRLRDAVEALFAEREGAVREAGAAPERAARERKRVELDAAWALFASGRVADAAARAAAAGGPEASKDIKRYSDAADELASPQQLPFAAPPSSQQGAPPAPPTKAPLPFAKALHKMLGDAPQLIRLEEGCVVIPSPSALEGILGKYYRTSKYTSFQRQLTGFGFHRQATAGRAGSLVTIYRRSPEAGGRIDSVDAILSIRRVVRLTRRRRLTHAPEDSDVEEEVPVDSDGEETKVPKRSVREKLIKWKLDGCTVAVTPITVVDEGA